VLSAPLWPLLPVVPLVPRFLIGECDGSRCGTLIGVRTASLRSAFCRWRGGWGGV
jgi:hypothetical protein